MLILGLIVGGFAAAGTYMFAKKKRASGGTSAAAAAITGVGAYGVTWATLAVVATFWPVFVLGGAAAGGYYYAKRKNMKALPPSAGA